MSDAMQIGIGATCPMTWALPAMSSPESSGPPSAIGFARVLHPGSRVVLVMRDPVALASALIELFEVGMVAVPVDPDWPQDRIDAVTRDAQAHAVFTSAEGLYLVDGREPLSPDDDCLMVYTSGTTGASKGVVIGRAALLHNAAATAQLHGFGPGRVHLTCLPLFHCNAIAMSLFGNYLTGGTVVFCRFAPHDLFEDVRRYGARQINLVPTMVADLVTVTEAWPSCLDYVLTAASALPQAVSAAFYAKWGANRLVQGYGLSEAVNFSFTMPLTLSDDAYRREMVNQHPPVGLPVGDTCVRLAQDGEVQILSPALMRGYWNRPEDTAAAFTADGWLRTGDLGFRRGPYLVLTGRSKEIIIRGGENISPVDVEAVYARAGIRDDVCVAAAADARLGEAVGLVCGRLLPFPIQGVEAKLQPAAVAVMPVPRTATGKPQRREASKRLVSLTRAAESYARQRAQASWLSRHLLSLGEPSIATAQVRYLQARAIALAQTAPEEPTGETALGAFLCALAATAGAVWRGDLSCRDAIRTVGRDRWTALMVDPPMGDYADLTAAFLSRAGLLNGSVLELGAGVGNLSRQIAGQPARYLRTDARDAFLTAQYGAEEMSLDFDQPFPSYMAGTMDVVVAVNALHCAADPDATLTQVARVLRPGGTVVLGEGNPYPVSDEPWALDVLFGFFDGWWNRGGFQSREVWLHRFRRVGFTRMGYGILRSGRYDLGGVAWAQH